MVITVLASALIVTAVMVTVGVGLPILLLKLD